MSRGKMLQKLQDTPLLELAVREHRIKAVSCEASVSIEASESNLSFMVKQLRADLA